MPSLQYYYYPFASRQDPTLERNRQKYAGKLNVQVLSGDFMIPFLDRQGILLIDGHCDKGAYNISAQTGGEVTLPTWEEINVYALAERLKRLPQNFVAIKMLGCKGRAFACQLAFALAQTQPGIHVGGYTKSIFHAQGYRAIVGQTPNTPNSNLVHWFNAKGAQVQKPALPRWNLDSDDAPFAYDPQYPT